MRSGQVEQESEHDPETAEFKGCQCQSLKASKRFLSKSLRTDNECYERIVNTYTLDQQRLHFHLLALS